MQQSPMQQSPMRRYRFVFSKIGVACVVAASSVTAFGQEPDGAPQPTATTSTEQVAATEGSSNAETSAAPSGSFAASEAATPPAEPAAAEGPAIKLALFADTYVSYNSSQTGTPVPYHRAYDNNAPFDAVTGFPATGDVPAPLGNRSLFGLSFVGLDASFDTGTVGATALLRLGPSVPIYYAADTGGAGIDSMLAGYVTVRPTAELTIDAGYFGTIYGAEVAESWRNLNYSRGGLYYAMQPFYHFGAKASYTLSDKLTLRAMLVNGANNVSDENDAPAYGLQLAGTGLGEGLFDFALGGFYEAGSDSAWGIESFVDVVATLHLGDVTVIANADYNINRSDGTAGSEDTSYYGVMGAASYAATDKLGVALRAEYLADSDNAVWAIDGADDVSVTTLTGTLDLRWFDHLIVRPELRYESSNQELYTNRDGDGTKTWFTGMIGVVATSGP